MGSRARSLPVDGELNYEPDAVLSSLPVRDQAAIDRLTALTRNPFRNLLPRPAPDILILVYASGGPPRLPIE
jgi:hypothetical protein